MKFEILALAPSDSMQLPLVWPDDIVVEKLSATMPRPFR